MDYDIGVNSSSLRDCCRGMSTVAAPQHQGLNACLRNIDLDADEVGVIEKIIRFVRAASGDQTGRPEKKNKTNRESPKSCRMPILLLIKPGPHPLGGATLPERRDS